MPENTWWRSYGLWGKHGELSRAAKPRNPPSSYQLQLQLLPVTKVDTRDVWCASI